MLWMTSTAEPAVLLVSKVKTMKTMSLEQFQHFLSSDGWTRQYSSETIEGVTRTEYGQDDDGELNQTELNHLWGYALVTSTRDGVEIQYSESWSMDEQMPDTLTTDKDSNQTWQLKGVQLVDDDGDIMRDSDVMDHIDVPREFSACDYSWAKKDIEDVDYVESIAVETFVIEVDNAPSIRFSGEKIARACSSDNQAWGSSYSGSTGRWTELTLYKTVGGKYVCEMVGRTRWQGERDRYSAKVCTTEAEVIEFFGHRWLAKELYADAGIVDVVDVE